MKDIDRVHRLSVLWKVWKKNFLPDNTFDFDIDKSVIMNSKDRKDNDSKRKDNDNRSKDNDSNQIDNTRSSDDNNNSIDSNNNNNNKNINNTTNASCNNKSKTTAKNEEKEYSEVHSIRYKSLELIMEQMFAEIEFLKDENAFLREEGTQKTKLISILTSNLLDNIENQQTYLRKIGVEFSSLKFKRAPNDDQKVLSPVHEIKKNNEENKETVKNEVEEEKDRTSPEAEVVRLFEDPFLKKEIIFLREETKEKSKLIAGLTSNLIQANQKQDFQLHHHEIKLTKLTKELTSLTEVKSTDNVSVIKNDASSIGVQIEVAESNEQKGGAPVAHL